MIHYLFLGGIALSLSIKLSRYLLYRYNITLPTAAKVAEMCQAASQAMFGIGCMVMLIPLTILLFYFMKLSLVSLFK